MATMTLNDVIENLLNLTKKYSKNCSSDFLEPWKETTKAIYDFIKNEEMQLGIPISTQTLSKLVLKNMDAEQIWQQLEFQNESLLSGNSSSSSNLCVMIAKLTGGFEDGDVLEADDEAELSGDSDKEHASNDEGEVSNDEGVEMADDLEDTIESRLKNPEFEEDDDGVEKENSDFSDLDADTFGDIALDGVETDEDEEEEDQKEADSSKAPTQSFFATSVDSQFFKLRESEWVADNDLIGEADPDDEDVDYMKDDEQDGELNEVMYDDFFDPPEQKEKFAWEKLEEKNKKKLEEGEEEEQEQEEDFEQEQEEDWEQEQENWEQGEDEDLEDGSKTNILEQEEKSKARKSQFEVSLEREQDMKQNLAEELYLEEKPWALKGEVNKDQRPENSTLEESLEYTVGIRQKPIITEQTTKKIEQLILNRVRSQAWDSVERRVKPNFDVSDYKRKLVLDQEKSKKSLAEIYEEEYIRKQEEAKSGVISGGSILLGPDEKVQELPVHKEIKEAMEKLFMQLDALSNFHFTPHFKPAEIKVVSNLPAITIEEAAPSTVNDASLLAPQEVVAPLRGELKGEGEKTSTDRKRERRRKKHLQKDRAKRQEMKLKEQLKKKNKDGLMTEDASVKVVQSAVKKGQIQLLEGSESKTKSSVKFFDQLQDQVSSQTKKRKRDDDFKERKKKNSKQLTMAQLLL